MAHMQQMVHIRPQYSHHWYLRICQIMAPRTVFWHRRNWY